MDINKKVEKLNQIAETLRTSVRELAELFKDNPTLEHLVWRLNKQISDIHREVIRNLDKEITDEEFERLIKKFEE